MFFKFKRPKAPFKSAFSASKPIKIKTKPITKSSVSLKHFHWSSLTGRCSVRRRARITTSTVATNMSPVPAPPPTTPQRSPLPYRPPSRIRCGTAVIPLMRASRARLAVATKRSATSPEHQLSKTPRVAASEHYNPIYDEVYSEADEYLEEEDDDIYEDVFMPRKKRVKRTDSLDLMQVSAMLEIGSPWKDSHQKERKSDNDERDVYALHGGDWISTSAASVIYDEVASTSESSNCSDSEEEYATKNDLDGAIYGWVPIVPPRHISWHSTAAFGAEKHNNAATHFGHWLHRESYIMEP